MEEKYVKLAKDLRDILHSSEVQTYHKEKRNFHDGKHTIQSLGIAIDEDLDIIVDSKLDWGRSSVDYMMNSLRFDAFRPPEFGATRLMYETNGYAVANSAIKNSLIGACAFVSTRPGDTSKGEPLVVHTAYAGHEATGRYSSSTGELEAGLVIEKYKRDPAGGVHSYLYFTPGLVTRLDENLRPVKVYELPINKVALTPFVFNQDLARKPLGESYFTRGAVNAAEAALRMLTVIQISSEVSGVPHYIITGSIQNPDGLDQARIDSVLATISKFIDTTGTGKLDIHQLTAQSPKPIIDAYNVFANNYASQMRVPLSLVGFIPSNGALSADQSIESSRPFDALVENARDVYGQAIRNMAYLGMSMLQGSTKNSYNRLIPVFRESLDKTRIGALGDAIQKNKEFFTEDDITDLKLQYGLSLRNSLVNVEYPNFGEQKFKIEDVSVDESGALLLDTKTVPGLGGVEDVNPIG